MNIEDFLNIGMRVAAPLQFEVTYSCYSMAFAGRANLEEGDKILLPPSALDTLARMNVQYPMLFELSNLRHGKRTHCGVLEFSAEEGRCYIPFWMMQNLLLEEGGFINVKNVSLKLAKFVKFRPQSVDFLDISNPRAVLEKTLRKYTCVTVGDQICIHYLDRKYFLEVREVDPDGAASIIETDCNVDFDEPVGYQEYEKKMKQQAAASQKEQKPVPIPRNLQKAKYEDADLEASSKQFKPFTGAPQRIDGKSPSIKSDSPTVESKSNGQTTPSPPPPAVPDPSLMAQPRQSMIGNKYSKKKTGVSAFTGPGHSLSK